MSNLTVDGDSDFTTTGTPDSFTVISDGPSGTEGVAAHINGVCRAVTELQTLIGNALTLKGTVADLVTRLSRVIHEDGAIAKGTAFPGTPIDGQPFYRTDQNVLYIYDAGTTSWTVGVDTGEFLKIDGTRDMTGDLKIRKAIPALRLKGLEGSAKDVQIREDAGFLIFFDNTGSEGSPTWIERARLNMADLEKNTFVPTGVILPYGNATAPSGYSVCDGATLSRTTEARLFAVIGTTFGVGDGSTTFNKPDLRGRTGIMVDGAADRITSASTNGANADTLGGVGGAQTHTLTNTEAPALPHTHNVQFIGPGGSGVAVGFINTSRAVNQGLANTDALALSNSPGGGGAHSNTQPWIALNYIIKL